MIYDRGMKSVRSIRFVVSVFVVMVSVLVCVQGVSGASEEFAVATIEEITTQQIGELPNGQPGYVQTAILSNSAIPAQIGSEFQPLMASQLLQKNEQVIRTTNQDGSPNVISLYQLPLLSVLAILLIVTLIAIAGIRGWYAGVGMVLTFAVLLGFTLPALLAGYAAVGVAVASAIIIGTVTTYLTHGWQKMSHQTVVSLAVTMLVVIGLSVVVTSMARLTGLGSDEAFVLQFLPFAGVDLRGLFLGGVMLGTLGILDDVIVAQVSVVQQLRLTGASLSRLKLFRQSMVVGQDHLASLVNTLVLAYLGANLPLLLLLGMSTRIPWWVMVSNQSLTEEIIRTLLGTFGVLLSVPLATLLAVWWPTQNQSVVNPTLVRSVRTSSADSSRQDLPSRSSRRRGPKATRIKRLTS